MTTIKHYQPPRAILVACAGALLGFGASNAHADFTLVTAGTITAGTDAAGVFGPAGASLAGKAYELAVTYADFTQAFNNVTATLEKRSGSIPGAVSVTINGVTSTVSVPTSYGAMLYANSNGMGYSALAGFQSGTDANGNSLYATQDLTSSSGFVTGPRLLASSYTAGAGDLGSVKYTSTTPISASAPSGTIRVTFTGTPSSSRTMGVMPVKGDVNGDGVIDCSDLRAARAGMGKTVKQPGFVPGADLDGNLMIDIRDIAAVTRLMPAGTVCQ